MKWQQKAKIMKIFSILPMGEVLYKFLQKNLGHLTPEPLSNIKKQIEIGDWLHRYNFPIEGKTFFEIGTGHNVIVAVGFFIRSKTRYYSRSI